MTSQLKRPLLRLLDCMVSIFWASLCSSSLFSIVSEVSEQLDEVIVGDTPDPGGVSDSVNWRLIVGCLLTSIRLLYARDSNQIHILRLGGQDQRPDAVLALPVGDQFCTMTWLTVILQTKRMLEYMLCR